MRFPLNCHYFLLPKVGFTKPKFVFGDIVKDTKSGAWGVVIGMTFDPPELTGRKAQWCYEIRLSSRSPNCTLMEFRANFNEEELIRVETP